MSDEQGAATVSGQPNTLDMAKHGQLLVPVKGFDKPIPLQQVAEGFLRHSDYTNKTQQLAADRRELESRQERFEQMDKWFKALDTNPQETFRALQRAYNLNPSDSASVSGEIEEVDPQVASLQGELQALKSQLEQSTQSTQELAASQELAEAFPDIAYDDVKAYIAANNMEPHRVVEAAKLMSFDRMNEEQAMRNQSEAQRQQSLDALVEAKQGLPPISSGAAPTPSPDMLPLTEPELPTFEQAFSIAQAEHGQRDI